MDKLKSENNVDNVDNVVPTICIPSISKDIKKNYIFDVFVRLKLGYIKKIDFKYNKKKDNNIVIIYFAFWYNNERVNNIRTKLLNGKDINLVYNFPHYWKCLLYKPVKK
jgi:hypothetical protein